MGTYRHGKKGEDTIIEVPVGTVISELSRESDDARIARDEEALGLGPDELRRLRRSRLFIKHPSGDIAEDDYEEAERILYKEGRLGSWGSALPEGETIGLDIEQPLERPVLISQGGLGGLGNPHFFNPASPQRPPRLASRGTTPSTITLQLELKLLADVGLVGFPNAGKSTILRALTGRKAEVAEYQFTTLNPQVGVVRVLDDGTWKGGIEEGEMIEESWRERKKQEDGGDAFKTAPSATDALETMRFTISDNPGLLPLASENYGLGHSFLRSIERSLVLAYVLDLSRPHPDQDLRALRHELEAYKPGLSEKSRLVIVNKADEVDEEVGRERLAVLAEEMGEDAGADAGVDADQGMELVVISAKFGLGMQTVVRVLAERVAEARKVQEEEREANALM